MSDLSVVFVVVFVVVCYCCHLVHRSNRAAACEHPPCPTSLEDFDVPEQYLKLDDGTPFLLCDSGRDDPDRFLIFGSTDALEMLAESSRWHGDGDGTFKTAPLIFKQMYSIHAEVGDWSLIPAVFIFVSTMTEPVYRR